jgi:2-keto-4-pentenoate hydratase
VADPAAAAAAVWAAWTGGTTIPALPPAIRPSDAAEGMAAQDALRELAGPSYGWKLAATSTAGQRHIGVDGPQPGPLFTRFRHEPGDTVPSADMHMRVAEAEFAFRMGDDVGPGDDPLAAVAALHLAIELPDSRFDRFEVVGAAQLAADAACAGRYVLGPEVSGWRELDLSTAGTSLWINGAQAATGSGAAVLGDPRTVLAWIADALPRFGHRLRAGDVVTTGTTTPPPTVGPGDEVRADFGELGSVQITLAP